MNKAVIGIFPDNVSAARAINDLKAYGFGGETISEVLREDVLPGAHLPGRQMSPAMEILKGLVIGAVAGAIIGAVAYYVLSMTLAWPASYGLTSPLLAAVVTMAIVGAICGLLEGLAAMAPMAAARRDLLRHGRGDALVAVSTDEAHAPAAGDLLRAAGAIELRRGACSVMDEFRTVENVQPETYGRAEVVNREPVEAPMASGEVAGTTPEGGAIG